MPIRTLFGKQDRGQDAIAIGLPGVQETDAIPDEVQVELLTRPREQTIIGEKQIAEAVEILTRYKDGKASLEQRVVEDEEWWKLRHWSVLKPRRQDADGYKAPEPASAWLFNAILNKHADAMDNYPEPVVLPRERSDEPSAKVLSEILPVLLECNEFEDVYSQGWWEKLKHGTGVYGVFWDATKENGLGDIEIRDIDLLKIFWEPGVTNIQDSRNLFIVELVDNDVLREAYPDKDVTGNVIDVKQYIYDDNVDTSEKSVVVDWYYKTKSASGQSLLQYVKFVGNTVLYASENDPQMRDVGWYAHGLYPVVFDCLFPEKGTPVGFGYVAICKDPQLYIDKLSGNILETSMMATKKRFLVSRSTNINPDQLLDWTDPIVEVDGELDDRRVREFTVSGLDSTFVSVLQMKIEEMKDTAANRDVNSGGSTSGITAASAIAALQEAGNKTSRDMISASYRAFTQVCNLTIEVIRQFYDEKRSFRITGQVPGAYEFIDVDNSEMKDQLIGQTTDGTPLYRRPVYDLVVNAQKKNPFSRMEQNERAKELYALGFFNPENAQQSLNALEMMDFEGIDKVKEQIQNGATLLNIVERQQQQIAQLVALVKGIVPQEPMMEAAPEAGGGTPAGAANADNIPGANPSKFSSGLMEANTPMTPYGQRLAQRSTPSVR